MPANASEAPGRREICGRQRTLVKQREAAGECRVSAFAASAMFPAAASRQQAGSNGSSRFDRRLGPRRRRMPCRLLSPTGRAGRRRAFHARQPRERGREAAGEVCRRTPRLPRSRRATRRLQAQPSQRLPRRHSMAIAEFYMLYGHLRGTARSRAPAQ